MPTRCLLLVLVYGLFLFCFVLFFSFFVCVGVGVLSELRVSKVVIVIKLPVEI